MDNEEQVIDTTIHSNGGSGFTEWANEPELAEFKDNVKSARREHDALISQIDTWQLTLNGGKAVKDIKNRSSIRPRVAKKQASWVYSSLSEPFLSSAELFDTKPVSADDAALVEEAKVLLNYHIHHNFNLVKFIDSVVREVVDNGTCVLKTYWEYSTATIDQDVEEIIINDLGQEEIVTTTEKVVKTITDNPNTEVCDIKSVIVDPTCKGNMDRCQFIAHEFEMSMGDLKADGRYSNLDAVKTYDNISEFNNEHDTSDFEFQHKTNKKVKIVEYWGYYDIHNNGTLEPILCSWVDNAMIRLELNPYADKQLPFIFIPYNPIQDSFYGESISEYMQDPQAVIGAMTRGIIDMVGSVSNGQIITKKGLFDPVNKAKFAKGQNCEFNESVLDIGNSIERSTYPQIPSSALDLINLSTSEIEGYSGVRPFSSGNGVGVSQSATAARSAIDAVAKRELSILRRISGGLIIMGNKFLSMCADLMEDHEISRITGNEEVFITKADRIKFDIDLKIATPEGDQDKIDKISFMLQTSGANLKPEIVNAMLAKLFRIYNMPDLALEIENNKPEPDPMEQKKAELEIALLEAQVLNEQAKGAENQVDVRLKNAKAEQTEAEANIKKQTFNQNDDGTAHARNIETKQLDSQNKIDEQDNDSFNKINMEYAKAQQSNKSAENKQIGSDKQ